MSIPRTVSIALALSTSSALALLQACGDDREPDTILLGPDATLPARPGDGSVTNRSDGALSGAMRLVHVAPGLPAIDFCTRRGPQELYVGPVLGRDVRRDAAAAAADASRLDTGLFEGGADVLVPDDAAVADAGAAGVAPMSASQYLSIEGSGTLEIAIVPAGQGSCGQPLASGQVTLEPGRLKTVVVHPIVQDAGRQSGVAAYDDTPAVTLDRAKLRLVYAAGGAVPRLIATLYGTVTTPLGALEPLLPLRPAAEAASLDALGYATIDPRPPPTTLGILREGANAPLTSAPADLGLAGTSVHTGFLVPVAAGYSLLYCNDVSTDGPRTQCVVLTLR